jgi:hypothetical protein
MIEPTKKDKKILRQAIDIGLQRDYLDAIIDLSVIIDKWKESKEEEKDKSTYHTLYSSLKDHDKTIARRYDGLTGGRYLQRTIELLADDMINENDLAGLSDELMEYIRQVRQHLWG